MTRTEYFTRWRAALQELDDRTLGIYVLHCTIPAPWPRDVTPLEPSQVELHARLFPNLSAERAGQTVQGKPDAGVLQRCAERFAASKVSDGRSRYEETVLALGQRTRALLQGDPTAHWNVAEERRRRLEGEWTRAEAWATQAEQAAAKQRAWADQLRTQLNTVQAELQDLTARAAKGAA